MHTAKISPSSRCFPWTRKISWAALGVLAAALFPAGAFAATYTVVDLGASTPSGVSNSTALAITANSEVVGQFDAGNGALHAVLWSEGNAIDLGTLGGANSTATAVARVNGELEIVGNSDVSGNTATHAFVWAAGNIVDLGTFFTVSSMTTNSFATGINAAGNIVGSSEGDFVSNQDAFLWVQGANASLGTGNFTDLETFAGGSFSSAAAINADNVIVGGSAGGNMALGNFTHAFLTGNANVLIDLGTLKPDDSGNSTAQANSDTGIIVGDSLSTALQIHGFRYTASANITDLGVLSGYFESHALAVNNQGQIVGYCVGNFSAQDAEHAYIYQDGQMTDLNSLTGNATWTVNRANGINAHGQIAATGIDASGNVHALLLLPVLHLPQITAQPEGRVVVKGRSVTLAVTATGAVTYQWYKNNVALTGTSAYSATLRINPVTATSAGKYYVIVANGDGEKRSATAILKVLATATLPRIVAQPRSVTAKAHATVKFTVRAAGTAPFTYIWEYNHHLLHNSADVRGAESATLTLKDVSAASAGSYRVVVHNPRGMKVSATATLKVRAK